MRHWIQSVKERWKTTSPKVEEKWPKELKQKMNNNIYTYDSVWNVPNSTDRITINDSARQQTVIIDGTLEVKGRDVLKEIDEMRDALLLLKRDVDMEAKYPKLKELKDAYEAQLEKYKTFDTLKESK